MKDVMNILNDWRTTADNVRQARERVNLV